MTPENLIAAIRSVLQQAVDNETISVEIPEDLRIERPKNRDHGDWSSNVAMQLAKKAGMNPREFAALVQQGLLQHEGVKSVDIAGPGFLNITLTAGAAGALAAEIVAQASAYGTNTAFADSVINVEFVSANPTGPMHVGHTRWAALGDSMVRILRACGANVTAEFYINDAGAQMDKFGASILARITDTEVPEGGYNGAYIADLGQQILAAHPEVTSLEADAAIALCRKLGYELQLAANKATLLSFGVEYDEWFSEQTLHDGGAVEKAVARLREQGHVFDQDDAIWLRTTDFTDDKDRVMIRSNAEPTYFAADAAYYLSKKDRGFVEKMYLLGADHHGYVNRLKAIAACAGDDPEKNIEILIGQLVKFGGLKQSKRAGNIIELAEIVEWIGRDAVRYSLSRYPMDSPLELDAEELRKQSNDNPVFYVQYAHARTHAVARNAATAGVQVDAFDATTLQHESEAHLLAALAEFPTIVAKAATLREPHRIARYLEAVAAAYHQWYAACRVTPLGENPVEPVHASRLVLNNAAGIVLANGLDLLGVSAPERM